MRRNSIDEAKQALLHRAIDEALGSLGDSIHGTLAWHLKSRGISLEKKDIDIEAFHMHLSALLGAGADMIMDMVWDRLQRQSGLSISEAAESKGSSLEKIQKAMEIGVA
jgi:hypothetical protein